MTSSSMLEYRMLAAWVIALTAALGALFIGEVLGKEPCSLCWYQRAFMFPISIILGVGLWVDDRAVSLYALSLALPGALLATWHLGLFWDIIPKPATPCSAIGPSCSGEDQIILGVPIALMSLTAFISIAALCALSLRKVRK